MDGVNLMKLVDNMEQVKRNIKVLESYRWSENHNAQYRKLIEMGICFLVSLDDEGEYIFSPSRFIGYIDNTYENHIKNNSKDGGRTNSKLNDILGSEPKENPQFEIYYKQFCEKNDIEYNETGAFRLGV